MHPESCDLIQNSQSYDLNSVFIAKLIEFQISDQLGIKMKSLSTSLNVDMECT